jgi:Flp pilus assembly protein TadD
MPIQSLLTLVIITVCLAACQSTQQDDRATADIKTLLKDELFPSYTLFRVESEEDVFYLGEEAKRFAERSAYDNALNAKNVSGFVNAILDYSDNGMVYRNNANTVANTTFNNRAANCLSLSIMTFALAQHLGLNTTFYEVDIPEYWTRRDGFSLLNGHINLRVSAPETSMAITIGTTYADVDFDPQVIRSHFPRIPVSQKSVLAMFYNNKGADAFVANSYTRAYSYFRAAAKVAPTLQQTWTNLGVLYRMQGDFEQAQRTYEHALSLDPENLTVWENLAILYRYQNRREEAAELFSKIETKRKTNPFYHFILGEQSFEDGKFEKALSHYQRAVRLDRKNHEVLFGMAKTYFELGDTNNAVRYLKSAETYAPDDYSAERYSSKLAVLARR